MALKVQYKALYTNVTGLREQGLLWLKLTDWLGTMKDSHKLQQYVIIANTVL